MRLIVHMGLHKTASTFLQSRLNVNRRELRKRGIWYARRPRNEPEHHPTAWALLAGDTAPLAEMLADAAAAGCHTTLFSSEELESILLTPQVARLIEQAAAAAGVTSLEWHVVLREPGACFESLHAQMHWHTYADSLCWFTEAMKTGHVFMKDPMPGSGTRPYWYFSFDHQAHLRAFAAATPWPLHAHDYRDDDPFPGWRMLDRIDALEALVLPPVHVNANNIRRDDVTIASEFCNRIIEAIDDPETLAQVAPLIEEALRANLQAVPTFGQAIGRRFGESHRAALAEFGIARADAPGRQAA